VDAGQIVVCCGGGGIPVAVDSLGRIRGVAAVIDKDRTTALLARQLAAPTLVILTAVEYACLNYGKPTETVGATHGRRGRAHLQAGHFAGSMRPNRDGHRLRSHHRTPTRWRSSSREWICRRVGRQQQRGL
jgi:carbamate kinase